MISDEIISRLKCTNCGESRWELRELDKDNGLLVCVRCNSVYPIIDHAIYLTPELYQKTIYDFIERYRSALKEREIYMIRNTIKSRRNGGV